MKLSVGIFLLAFSQPAIACDYGGAPEGLGTFSGDVAGRFVDRDYSERPLFQLSGPFSYETQNEVSYSAIDGYVVDGASIPQWLWGAVGGPFSGKHLKASVVHDYYTDTCQVFPHPEANRECQNSLEIFVDDDIVHQNYYLGLLAEGMSESNACKQFLAVSTYKQWDIDESGRPTNILIYGRPIGNTDDGFLTRAAGLARASITASLKTRKSTSGQTLNIYEDGAVPATPDGIQEYLQRLTRSLNSEDYLANPDALGLLTDEQVDDFDNLSPWQENFLEDRFDADLGNYSNLTYFDTHAQLENSDLAKSLGLEVQPFVTVPDFDEHSFNWGLLDDSDTKEQILKFLTQENMPDDANLDALRLYQSNDGSDVIYEIAPSLADQLSTNEVPLPYGTNGRFFRNENFGDSFDTLVQPAPSQ